MQPCIIIYHMIFCYGMGGSNKVFKKIRRAIRNYLWSGNEHITRTWVSWRVCCLSKKSRGLGLVDLEMAKTNLLWKWILKAMEPDEFNLQ